MLRMKNSQTGEVRDVERDSPEHLALLDEVSSGGDAAWNEVGETPSRFASDSDIKANDISNVRTEEEPWKALSPAEIEAGITSWEQKAAELGIGPAKGSRPRRGRLQPPETRETPSGAEVPAAPSEDEQGSEPEPEAEPVQEPAAPAESQPPADAQPEGGDVHG